MIINLLYLRILKRADPSLPMPSSYLEGEQRWLATYRQFKPAIPHRVVVVNCGLHTEFDSGFDEVAYSYAYYDGQGSDCGTYQAIASQMDCDLCVCCNTLAYFWRPGWLEPFAEAFQKYGKGVYGATASYESFPHLRTPCIGFAPEVMRRYPHVCDSRQKAIQFESGRDNFTLWAIDNGYPAVLVAADGFYRQPQWRTPDNIFRRGDQSNVIVWDRHTKLYAEATEEEKAQLASAADRLFP